MKKVNFLVSALIALFIAGFTSCSSSDDSEEVVEAATPTTELSVSVYDLTIDSNKNSSASFTIKSNADWSISNLPDWITLSSTRGNGNATITVKATSDNNSASDKTGSFTVATSDKSIEINVTQIAGLMADCDVRPTEITIMSQSVAFDFKFGEKVSYFYYGYIEKAEVGSLTDDEIEEITQAYFKRNTPKEEENIYEISGLNFETEYYIVSFGYDKEGNRGEMKKTLIKTKKYYDTNERPSAKIGRTLQWDGSKWLVDIESISSQTKKYYIYSEIGDLDDMPEYNGGETTQAKIALKMKRLINSGKLNSHVREGEDISCAGNIVGAEEYVYVAVWAVGEDEEFATDLDYCTWTLY